MNHFTPVRHACHEAVPRALRKVVLSYLIEIASLRSWEKIALRDLPHFSDAGPFPPCNLTSLFLYSLYSQGPNSRAGLRAVVPPTPLDRRRDSTAELSELGVARLPPPG